MTSGQPQGDIIIDPTYHRTPYFRQSTHSHNRERRFPPFMFTGIQTSGKVHSITTPVGLWASADLQGSDLPS